MLVERHGGTFRRWEGGGGGGKEIFAPAEIHVRLIILKIRCINSFFIKTKVEINIFNLNMHGFTYFPQNGDQNINTYAKFDV